MRTEFSGRIGQGDNAKRADCVSSGDKLQQPLESVETEGLVDTSAVLDSGSKSLEYLLATKQLKEVSEKEFNSRLTDPTQHDPNHFCYIVHAINPAAKNGLLICAIMQGGYDFNQEVDLLSNPESISSKKLISCSLINQGNTGTWGDVFFIIDVPFTNHVQMSNCDSATNITNPDFVLEYAKSPYCTPEELIASTQKGDYNEVVVTGNKNGNKVRIIGIGIKVKDLGGEGVLKEPDEAARMREIAKELDIPVIEFIEKSVIVDSKPEVNLRHGGGIRSIYFNKNGYRYCFEKGWNEEDPMDTFKSVKNEYRGHEKITKKEYLTIRTNLEDALLEHGEAGKTFLDELDQFFNK